jgi:hypothetical protein
MSHPLITSSSLPQLLFPTPDIMQRVILLAVGLGHLSQFAAAACAGPLNTLTGCNVASPFVDGVEVYYSPGDAYDVGAGFVANGLCSPGSYAPVQLIDANLNIYDCGCLALGGTLSSPIQNLDWYNTSYSLLMLLTV